MQKQIDLQKIEEEQQKYVGANDAAEAAQYPRAQRTLLTGEKERVTHVYGDIAYYCLHGAGRYQRSGHAARTLQKFRMNGVMSLKPDTKESKVSPPSPAYISV